MLELKPVIWKSFSGNKREIVVGLYVSLCPDLKMNPEKIQIAKPTQKRAGEWTFTIPRNMPSKGTERTA